MGVDVLILNTAVVDFRRADFEFADALVCEGGLTKCREEDRPDYSQKQLAKWIRGGFATAGGCGNAAPVMARAGLKVAVGINLGRGNYDGLDAQGRFFCDLMVANGVDMSATFIHSVLPTGTTYIHHRPGEERGGIAYFAGANDDFDFEMFKGAVERLEPRIVYYLYCGLSQRGDADNGQDLAEFIKWCRNKGAVTVVDTSTLTGNPQQVIRSAESVPKYRLLEAVLPEVDIFFTSSDEARMIENTLSQPRNWRRFSERENNKRFLDFLGKRFWVSTGRTKLFGVTFSRGAYEKHMRPDGQVSTPAKVESRFLAGEVVDLVGAGDSFRAGLITYICCHLDEFNAGSMDFGEAVQMGNLFAALYIKAPLNNRHGNIRSCNKMLTVVRSGITYPSLDALHDAFC
ncbi:MAG: carbohydrate kinase family protein [Planctomycetota bacterium]|jgi:sugar/nucleoside kinase (ribokinase family)